MAGSCISRVRQPNQASKICNHIAPIIAPLEFALKPTSLSLPDVHPDEFYKVHTSTGEDDACHRGKGASGTYGAETSDCDSPFSLVNATFDWIQANLKDQIDFIIWTGDSARHDSDEKIPRSRDQVLGTNRWLANKFSDVFANPDGKGLSIPVIPNLGNNDILPHNIMFPGPNKWLRYYTDIWRRFIPEEQRHSFEYGGWFYVEVIPNKLAVFSLNTLYLFDRNAAVDNCVNPSEPGFKQLEWLRIQLGFMRDRGMKAIIMGHVPPARTAGKQLWDETCWQKYTLWLRQYRDIVTGAVWGHMNVDHFFLQDSKEIQRDKLSGGEADSVAIREAMEDDMSVQSKADYLLELRCDWSKLSKPALSANGADQDNKKKKHKKPDPWSERYQLSLVSPSVVPNFFPTLRVFEYNISGLEKNPVWSDALGHSGHSTLEEDEERLELRDTLAIEPQLETEDRSQRAQIEKKKKGRKGKKPKAPNPMIPDPPAKSAPPGPAYSPQPLTLTGYTQYFANLTYINNDMTVDGGGDDDDEGASHADAWSPWPDWVQRWREGKHRNRKPKNAKPKPREFEFEVEYSTFDDKMYDLADLTVGSFVELAYRIGRGCAGEDEVRLGAEGGADGDEAEANPELDSDSDSDSDFDSDAEVEAEAEGKKKKKKKKREAEKAWLHFLQHAFVSTVEKKDLKKLY